MEGKYAKMTFILHNTLMSAHHSLVSEMANEQKKHLKNLVVTPESRTFALAKRK